MAKTGSLFFRYSLFDIRHSEFERRELSELGYFTSGLLGVVQGLTEFLPISSSGHLALTQSWLDLEPDSTQMLLFDVLAHLGTLLAVGIVFAASARRFLHRLISETSPAWPGGKRVAWRIALLALIASVVTGVIGLLFKDRFEAAFANRLVIGLALIVTGVLLAFSVKTARGRRGWKQFRWWQALLVGLAQAVAITPGISRSGATICVATYCGLRRRWAAEFSFLIAVPAIVGATLLKLRDSLPPNHVALAPTHWGPILLGSLVSFVVGIVALRMLLGVVRRAKLHYFAIYCWIAGALTLLTAG